MNKMSLQHMLQRNNLEPGEVREGKRYIYEFLECGEEEDVFKIKDKYTGEGGKLVRNKLAKRVTGSFAWEVEEDA